MVDLAKNLQRAGKNLISMWSPRVVGLGIPGEFDCISFPHDMKIGLASDWLHAVDTPTKISPILPTKFLVIEGPNTCDQIEFYVFHSCLLEFLKNAGYIPVHAVYVL